MEIGKITVTKIAEPAPEPEPDEVTEEMKLAGVAAAGAMITGIPDRVWRSAVYSIYQAMREAAPPDLSYLDHTDY